MAGISAMRAERPGRYGSFGGQFVAPVLLPVLDRLEAAFEEAWADRGFRAEFERLLHSFVGRPTPISELGALIPEANGVRIVLKRDDLTFNGGNYANSALGQCLLARRMGLESVVTDTGSGQNGIATAAVAAHLGMKAVVYIGARDAERYAATVKKIRAFGADLRVVADAEGTLHAATSAAVRHWMGTSDHTAYVAGAPIGAHPYPRLVSAFQSVIGNETRLQMIGTGQVPAAIVSAVGGGSSTIGIFSAFLVDKGIRLLAVEAGGDGGPAHSARLAKGRRGVLHGAETLVLSDENGQILSANSIASGLAYPGSSPELANLVDSGRVETTSIGDAEALDAVRRLAEREGILISLEAGHALAAAEQLAATLPAGSSIVVMVPASGDKDLDIVWPES
ncbi:tryptophan synthase subunit beta [Devosia sp. 63-57]|uniref:tryptophan synthase subunit beta n=1 Tax=Devosia sp. 63-57 TaxID=1895751 RepID=UPI00086CCC4A|nr:tryptophan synthase subunit beta [Devosia sp. 63-57]ODT50943.1 MAG: tryptophan synthase subunit beta [Pelagibacterium sp. SCN 63-126]ODU85674.1 MAG: tryptophan synthase subunit beta [Pelagibacterium sp. SCN 63-17]OJX44397.1 MAG: tryptophan synthase subunit beta [Devosia sp. 63-57]